LFYNIYFSFSFIVLIKIPLSKEKNKKAPPAPAPKPAFSIYFSFYIKFNDYTMSNPLILWDTTPKFSGYNTLTLAFKDSS